MEPGEPIRRITVEPVEQPVPAPREPAPSEPAPPVTVPEREKVPA